ncbi:head maturation protease, ClpP-related [Palleronia caenipelagi]|uniref:ATP-dependent Clp protease proteolytic subunit n=1 Tax=Palleronia caenipelagi TaxID=2489174 RepID=A0A547Q6A2_9RHOB|nr:head maturation protease, ClpP-related [Palleronia caenipelagi]TRD21903.1 Clp protease ClpP [Palleronia caenipelagi]
MSKRDLPAAVVSTRPGIKSDIADVALKRWNPDIRAAEGAADQATISILEPIGEDIWGDGVSARRIAAALRYIGERDVVVTINSPGGNFFEGLAIYNLLVEHPGAVSIKIVGLAASAASVIAMAGDDIQIARSAFLMIHNTWVAAAGDRHALRGVADWLEPFDQAAVDVYHARSGVDTKTIAAMLDKETWIAGTDAVDQGFADRLLGDADVANAAGTSLYQTAQAAQQKLDIYLARGGATRSERRKLCAAMKGGKPDAAPTGMPRAAATELARKALETLNTL